MDLDFNFDMLDTDDGLEVGFSEPYPNGFDRYNYLPVNDLPDDFSITPKMAEELMHFDELLMEGRIDQDEYNKTVLRIVEMARKQGQKAKVNWQKNGF